MDRVRRRAVTPLLLVALAASLLTAAVVAVTPSSAGAVAPAGAPSATTGRVQVVASYDFTCELRNGGVRCWGENDRGQLGLGDTARRGDQPGEIAALAPLPLARAAVQVTAGYQHACALLDDGSVTCWGANGLGQLGLGDTADRGDQPGEIAALAPLPLARPATQIAAGTAHTCALHDDGTVTCWGMNTSGQLGLGDTANRGDEPGEIATLGTVPLPRRVAAIATGYYHACALLDDGTVTCWGMNGWGQLGLGDTANRGDEPGEIAALTPIPLPRAVTALAAGMGHTCALLDDGTTTCWGMNSRGELGLGDTANRGDEPGEIATLGTVPLPRRVAAIRAGMQETCVRFDDGTASCWGDNELGMLGLGDTANRGDEPGEIATLGTVPLPRRVVDVSAGRKHVCVVLDDRTVSCWGRSGAGELGLGDLVAYGDQPGEVATLTGVPLPATPVGVAQVATGGQATCVLLTDARVKCWGDNRFGQLGLGDTAARGDAAGEMGDALPAVDLGTGARAVQLAVGYASVCALLADGTVKCWGANTDGRLGLGDTANRGDGAGEMGDALPAVDLGTGARAVQLAAGTGHACALLADGTTKCWGANSDGQLGQGDTARRGDGPNEMGDALAAVDLGTGARVASVQAGDYHTCARLADGTATCWGWNVLGGLGLGDTASRGDGANEMGANLPTIDLGTGARVTQLDAAGVHTCARLADGTTKCWGGNSSGQLGRGDTTARGNGAGQMGANLSAIDLGAGVRVVQVTAGGSESCAQLGDGTARCWGAGGVGALGQGDTANRGDGANEMGANLPPIDLGTGVRVVQLVTGLDHVCALLGTGALKCWGSNGYGQLGQGDSANRGDGANEMGANLPPIVLVDAPTASIAGPATSGGTRTVTFTINANETVAGLTADDLSTSGTATGCVATPANAPTWASISVSVTCATDGTLVLRLRAGAVVDGSQNPGPVTTVSSSTVAVADPVPGAQWYAPDSPVDGTSIGYTLAFGEQVSGFSAADITISGTAPGCVATPAGGTEQSFYVPVQCSGDGTVILTLNAGSVLDAGGNPAPATAVVAPTVVLGLAPTMIAVSPARLFDTRTGTGGVPRARLANLAPLTFHVTGTNGVPAIGVAAVSLNVTVVEPSGDGYATVYPCGTLPNTSNVNFRAGVTTANAVITPVSAGGDICVAVFGDAHVIADVNGWYASGAGFTTVNPTRLLDTRTGTGGVPRARLASLTPLTFHVAGTAGVPSSGVGAVSLNVTVVEPSTDGYATVYPCGTLPNTSNVNFRAGVTTANAVITPVTGGDFCIAVFGDAHVIADVNGWYATGAGFTTVNPSRLLDTRTGTGGVAKARLGSTTMPLTPLQFTVAGTSGIPGTDVGAVSLNVTIVEPASDGYATVYPCGTMPGTSNVNFRAGATTANAVITPVSTNGRFCIAVFGNAHVIADVNGWYRS